MFPSGAPEPRQNIKISAETDMERAVIHGFAAFGVQIKAKKARTDLRPRREVFEVI